MTTIGQESLRLAKIRSLLLLTIPLAIGTVVTIYAIHAKLSGIVAMCGLMIAIIGGCTKIGSP